MELEITPARRHPRSTAPGDRPFVVAAIDAGSSALRAAIARVDGAGPPEIVQRFRVPVRIGHGVFAGQEIGEPLRRAALAALVGFAERFAAAGALRVRAVGTSALREARDGQLLIAAVRHATGIVLEPIDGGEEARLVRAAVLRGFPSEAPPELIADLGGGSLELSVLYRGETVSRVDLPLGTVRLLETRGVGGVLDGGALLALRRHVLAVLRGALPRPPGKGARVALCGGNPRTLQRLFPGAGALGLPTLDAGALASALPQIAGLDPEDRVSAYDVERDRAEVLAIAAVVVAALAEWMDTSSIVVPGVGVIDGMLHELAALGVPRRELR